MREILIERARARAAAKRGGSRVRVSLDEAAAAGGEISLDLILLDGALTRLAGFDPELARLVELRFFGGLTLEETAEALGVSLATVKRDWNLARGWLRKEVLGEAPGAP
jgi:RNA polymerase sigma factor (TIGR02999 family)